jgi:hypothetical protein
MKVKDEAGPHFSDCEWAEVAVSAWRKLGSPAIGGAELAAIQKDFSDSAGEIPSPASIARVLAKAGADLRHPEIIEFDARWRGSWVQQQQEQFAGFDALLRPDPPTLVEAETALIELENLRLRFAQTADKALFDLQDLAISAREAAASHAADLSLSLSVRETHAEIAEWLRVWLETPALFTRWLDLRKSSKAFADKFALTNPR